MRFFDFMISDKSYSGKVKEITDFIMTIFFCLLIILLIVTTDFRDAFTQLTELARNQTSVEDISAEMIDSSHVAVSLENLSGQMLKKIGDEIYFQKYGLYVGHDNYIYLTSENADGQFEADSLNEFGAN